MTGCNSVFIDMESMINYVLDLSRFQTEIIIIFFFFNENFTRSMK